MGKVLIIGSGGVIGTVLKEHLPHETSDFDLPEYDASRWEHVYDKATGHDTIVHLAWDFTDDGWPGQSLNPSNVAISFNVFQAALDAGVRRVIVASSVHADKFHHRKPEDGLLYPFALPLPDSPYGASKAMLEALGRYYADSRGLEVVCIRFGGVNKENTPPQSPDTERQVWLSHRDCASLVQACIDAPTIPYNYTIVYAISNNKNRLHDLVNPFGWQPRDGA